jgi:hypothetical protein
VARSEVVERGGIYEIVEVVLKEISARRRDYKLN